MIRSLALLCLVFLPAAQEQSTVKKVVLVELFTSQG